MKFLFLLFTTITFSQPKTNHLYFAAITENCSSTYGDNNKKLKLFENQVISIVNYLKDVYGNKFEFYDNGNRFEVREHYVSCPDSTKAQIIGLSETLRDSVRINTIKHSIELHELEMKRANEFYQKAKTQGIAITDYSINDESEYTNGTGYTIDFVNTNEKTIKYIWFTLNGYNRVDDFVSTKNVKAMGPIKPGHAGTGSFSYVWNTDLINKVKLTGIKIQYMDGSFITVKKPKDCFLSERCAYLLFGDPWE